MEPLDEGGHADLWMCISPEGAYVACKVFQIENVLEDDIFKHFKNELEIHSRIRYKHIPYVIDAFFEKNRVYVVMEFCEDGDLRPRVESGPITEDDAKLYFYQVLLALDHLHGQGIAHRDVTLSNVLLVGNHVKLADLGYSKVQRSPFSTRCGTSYYVAPEVIHSADYDGISADMWSAGVLLYHMVFGRPPWDLPDEVKNECVDPDRAIELLAPQICSGIYSLEGPISQPLKELLMQLLNIDPKQRITSSEALQSEWFEGFDRELLDEDAPEEPDVDHNGLANAVKGIIKYVEGCRPSCAKNNPGS